MVYAQLCYLAQVKVAGEAAMASYTGKTIDRTKVAQQFLDAEVQFVLGDFKVGDIQDIANEKWGDIITPPLPPMQILKINVGSQQFTDNDLPMTEWQTASAQWVPADPIPPAVSDTILNKTVAQIIALASKGWSTPDVVYSRYATFLMTSTFQLKTITFKAVFFFGKNSKGEEVASPQNLLTTFSGPMGTTTKSSYPSGLMHSHLRDTTVLADWLVTQAVSAPDWVPGKHQLSCSGSRCGVALNDLQQELATPIPPPEK